MPASSSDVSVTIGPSSWDIAVMPQSAQQARRHPGQHRERRKGAAIRRRSRPGEHVAVTSLPRLPEERGWRRWTTGQAWLLKPECVAVLDDHEHSKRCRQIDTARVEWPVEEHEHRRPAPEGW
jgi:hypothetical protein